MDKDYQSFQPPNNNPASLLPFEICVAAMRGWRMFPVKVKGKLPLISEWPAKASSDPDVLAAWAIEYPSSNWGLATGRPSGVFVVDVDGEAGRASVADLERQGLVLPPTRTVTTGRDDGGAHLYFRLPESVDVHNDQNGRIGPHIDVRGTGGFVVLPPSIHPTGRTYQCANPSIPIADAPAWVIDRLTAPAPRPPAAQNGAQNGAQTVGTGGRTKLLVSLAGTMHRRGMSPEAIEKALLEENAQKCDPPLPEEKVRAIAHDIPRRYPNGPAPAEPKPDASPSPADDEWQEPEDLGSELPPVPPFDLELMPKSFRPLVKDVAERMQVPMDFPAVAAIETLAGVTNRRALIQPKREDDTWIVVPNLWGGIVAPPGMLKSPVIATMTKPARAIEAEWRKEDEAAYLGYQNALEEHELRLSAWKDQFKAATKKNQTPPTRPEFNLIPPVQRRLIINDSTPEKTHELLVENPAGLLQIRDELTGWLAGMEKQGREQERAFNLECWAGDSSFTSDRITRGSKFAPHVCTSVFGGIQPARWRAYLSDALRNGPSNDGFVQRFQLTVWPDAPEKWEYIDRKPDKDALESTAAVYRRIVALDAENPLLMRFDDQAQELFERWLSDLEEHIRNGGLSPHMQAHLSKYRSLMPSLALLFALADGHMDSVPLAHAKLACAWCDYLEAHANRVYSAHISPERLAAISLAKRLKKGWKSEEGKFTLREVYSNTWSGLGTPEEAEAALRLLEDAGWVRKTLLKPPTGRPSLSFTINPRVGGSRVCD